MAWRIHGASESYRIALRGESLHDGTDKGLKGPTAPPLDPEALPLDQWLAEPTARPLVIQILQSVAGRPDPLAPRLRGYDVRPYLKRRLLDALRKGDLLVYRVQHLSSAPIGRRDGSPSSQKDGHSSQNDGHDGAAVQPPGPSPSEKTTWVELELLDQDGMPVPNVHYELTLPTGEKKAGSLGSDGRAMVSGISPGQCKLSFPDIDASEWDTA